MSKVRCPICDLSMPGHWQDYPNSPFCSRRCKTIDLGRWLGEEYRVEGKDADDNRSTPGEAGEEAR